MQQIPRADNITADHLANYALDHGDFHRTSLVAWQKFLDFSVANPNSSCGLCVQVDGAARGNPCGPASWGVAVWYGLWMVTGFEAFEQLESHAEAIGHGSNNLAEYAGCRHALSLLLY